MSSIGDVLAEIRDFTWDLGGASGEVRSAAGVWWQLQADLLTEHANLLPVAGRLRQPQVWTDEAGTRAVAFIDALASELRDQATQCGRVASSLEDAASRIDAANAELHGIYVQIGIQLGIDLALQWVPFVDIGLDAATVVRALLWLDRGRTIVAELIAFLSRLLGLFVLNTVSTFVIRAAERAIVTGNAVNALAWTQTDLKQSLAGAAAASIPGAVIGGRGGLLLSSLPRLSRLSVPLVRGMRVPLGGFLRTIEPYPTYLLTAGAAGMGGSALNSLMDHQRPTWSQVLSAGAWSVAAAGLGAGTLTFASRLVSRGPVEWPGPTRLKVASGLPFSWIKSNSRLGRIANWRVWSSDELPLFPRTQSGSVLVKSARIFVVSARGEVEVTHPFEMTMSGHTVGRGLGAQPVRDFGILMAPRGIPEYFPLKSALRPGTERAFARPGAQMLVGNLFNLAFDVNPIVGAQVREAKHLEFQSAAPNLGALPTIHPLAALAPPAPGHLARHDVRPGDTLWAIAAAQYGDPTVYADIARANGIADPDLIHPGQHLVLPAIPPPAQAPGG